MIYTLTLNPSVDLIISLERFTEGRVNLSDNEYKLPGGKGINVSQVMKNLGHDSMALGFIGGFTGKFIKEELEKKHVKSDFVEVAGDTRINIKMKDNKAESEINGNSPEVSKENLGALLEKLKELKKNDILVMCGSVPKTIPEGIYREILESVEEGVRLIVDSKGEALAEAVKGKPFMIKPNNHELGDMFGVEIKNQEDIIRYGRKLVEMGAENVIVSMAGEGALLIDQKNVYFGSVPKGILVNSVGAGDSLVGGFTAGLIEGLSITEAFKKGIASGSASAFSENLCTLAEVEKLLGEIEVRKIF